MELSAELDSENDTVRAKPDQFATCVQNLTSLRSAHFFLSLSVTFMSSSSNMNSSPATADTGATQ